MNRAERRRQRKLRRNDRDSGGRDGETDSFQAAVADWRAGRIESARAHCARVLRDHPDHADAINLDGVLLVESDRHADAAERFAQALTVAPDNPSYRFNHADALHTLGNLDDADTEYSVVLGQDPNHIGARAGLGRLAAESGRPAAAIDHFRAVLDREAGYFDAVCGIARCLGQQGRTEEALSYIRAALRAAPQLSAMQDRMFGALKAGQASQIPIWHFSMLADAARNAAYQRTIERCVGPDSHVLDIGTGSGLLAMMAARAGARKVTACEMSKPIAEAARRVVAENGFADVIDVIAKPSTALRVGTDLAERADILVSEILDSGLTGEGVVKVVRHAKRELLTSYARIVPYGATVEAALVSLPRLRPVNPVSSICGFDLTAFARFQNLQDYQSIDLRREPHGFLSGVFHALDIDFYDLPAEASSERPIEKAVDAPVVADGALHGVAYWFDLRLDKETAVSSGPEGDVVHWGQAVQFFETDVPVRTGDIARLTMYFDELKIRWRIDEIVPG